MAKKAKGTKPLRPASVIVELFDHDNADIRGERPWMIADNASAPECRDFVCRLWELVRIAESLSHNVLVLRSADGNSLEVTLVPNVITVEAPHD